MFFDFSKVLSNLLFCVKMDTDFGFIFAIGFFVFFAVLLVSLVLIAFIPKKSAKKKKQVVLPTIVSVDKENKTIYDMQNKKVDVLSDKNKMV